MNADKIMEVMKSGSRGYGSASIFIALLRAVKECSKPGWTGEKQWMANYVLSIIAGALGVDVNVTEETE